MDVHTPEQRHRNMSAIKGKDTKPEILVRKALHAMGYRFRLHRKDLPGKPDIVLPRHKVAIFVNGCFWHRHAGCQYASTPSTNADFWNAKFEENVARDKRNYERLKAMGWLPIGWCKLLSVKYEHRVFTQRPAGRDPRPSGLEPRPTGTLGENSVFIFYRKKFTPASKSILKYCTGILLGKDCALSNLYVEKLIQQHKNIEKEGLWQLPNIIVEKVELDKLCFKVTCGGVFEDFENHVDSKEKTLDEKEIRVREYMSMAEIYRFGNERIDVDIEKSIIYYEKAAQLGFVEAIGTLIHLFEVLGREKEAEKWRTSLGEMCFSGDSNVDRCSRKTD